MELKSVAKPVGRSALESMEAAAGPARELLGGSSGSAPDHASRAAAQFLVRGTSTAPLLTPRRSALESLLEAEDRRKQILETDLSPWRMICSLQIESADGRGYIGTGWFLGPRTIITAGHCVYDAVELGGWARKIVVMPGRNGAERPFGQVESSRLFTTDRWMSDRDPDFDYGAIQLDRDLGATVGTFKAGSMPDAALQHRLVNISGYPGPRGDGAEQYFHANRVKAVTGRRVFYDVDTQGGQSGSPVWTYEDGDPSPIVIGIHAYGIGGVPANLNVHANSGPRILPEVLTVMRGWMGN
jgi:V8-like Glu-specific endopeptidase